MWMGRGRGANTHVDGQGKEGKHTCGWAEEGGPSHVDANIWAYKNIGESKVAIVI